ncbi:twin-arginine translocation signal domain-containing protein [Halorussus halophilus]|uniref:twin-arginine translocation signal domain-containing protein n=1 Tax=Halorussus halophilus TaxID=2650975 RepID=UPI0013012310|nr:twin-arginine translocation signal domain-containing protein [Halorussus halophilus]
MNRRQFVGSAGTALASGFAGCAGFGSEAGGTPYALELHHISPDGYRVEFAANTGDLTDEMLDVFLSALDGKHRTYGHRPFKYVPTAVEKGGEFYRIHVEETGQKTHQRTTLRGEVVTSESAERRAVDFVEFENGPAVRQAIEYAKKDDATSEDYYVFHDSDPDSSDLLPEPEHEFVSYDGQVFRLVVGQYRLIETEYTHTTEKVADTETAFREYVYEEVVTVQFDRSKMSEKQRGILRQARRNDYRERKQLSEDYRALLSRIWGGKIPSETTGNHLKYENDVWRATLHVSSYPP